eukprot:CAMPEP_0118902354 /NCGR_PEP_ID=MMETSP1166-20130328/7674_1 /TAXON_ID=1104430 /ORGANISM="Chrysoreinhardia sp, Strain CCMP3193" /LENGTH=2406 /DNA_ID=CAMNT_0006841559 /DNA_START=80 /DNA_END=7300 /DNA_ORIENTATION=+
MVRGQYAVRFQDQRRTVELSSSADLVSAACDELGISSESVVAFSGSTPLPRRGWASLVKGGPISLRREVESKEVDSTPASGVMFDRTRNEAGGSVARRTHVEFVANSLRAVKEVAKPVIKCIYVYEEENQLAQMVFVDNGSGMNDELLKKWSQLARRDEAAVRRGVKREPSDEPSRDFGSHADGELHFFGRGSKAAGFNAGETVGVLSKRKQDSRIFFTTVSKKQALENELNDLPWAKNHIKHWPKDTPDLVFDRLDELGGGSALKEILTRELGIVAGGGRGPGGPNKPESFSIFIVSDLYPNVVEGLELGGSSGTSSAKSLDFGNFESVAEDSSRNFACYLEPELNALGFTPRLEVEAYKKGGHSWKFILSDADNVAGTDDAAADPGLEKAPGVFPLRLDPARQLMRELAAIRTRDVPTHFDVNFQVVTTKTNHRESILGTVHCRIFVNPRRAGKPLQCWSPDDGRFVAVESVWCASKTHKRARFQCYWKGQNLYDFGVDQLWFMKDLEKSSSSSGFGSSSTSSSSSSSSSRLSVLGLLSFGSLAATDERKQKFGDAVAQVLNGKASSRIAAAGEDAIHQIFEITYPGNARSTTNTAQLRKTFGDWYDKAMRTYDQHVTVEFGDDGGENGDNVITKATVEDKILKLKDKVVFHPTTTLKLAYGEEKATMAKRSKFLTPTIRKAVGSIEKFELLPNADPTSKDHADLRVWLRREPADLFDKQPVGPFSLFKLDKFDVHVRDEINARAPKYLRSNFPAEVAWTAGETDDLLRLEIVDGASSAKSGRRLMGWHTRYSDKAEPQKFAPTLDVRDPSKPVDTLDRRPWRGKNYQLGTVVATTTGCEEPTPQKPFFEWPADWIEKYVLNDGTAGQYYVRVFVPGWFEPQKASKIVYPALAHRNLGHVDIVITCRPGAPTKLEAVSLEKMISSAGGRGAQNSNANSNAATTRIHAGDAVRLFFAHRDCKGNDVARPDLYETSSSSSSSSHRGTSSSSQPRPRRVTDVVVEGAPLRCKSSFVAFDQRRQLYSLDLDVLEEAEPLEYDLTARQRGDEATSSIKVKICAPLPTDLRSVGGDNNGKKTVENFGDLDVELELVDANGRPTKPPDDGWYATIQPEQTRSPLELSSSSSSGGSSSSSSRRRDGPSSSSSRKRGRSGAASAGLTKLPIDANGKVFFHGIKVELREEETLPAGRRAKSVGRRVPRELKRQSSKADEQHTLMVMCYSGDERVKAIGRVDLTVVPSKLPHFMKLVAPDEGVLVDGDVVVVDAYGKVLEKPIAELERPADEPLRDLRVAFFDASGEEVIVGKDDDLRLQCKVSCANEAAAAFGKDDSKDSNEASSKEEEHYVFQNQPVKATITIKPQERGAARYTFEAAARTAAASAYLDHLRPLIFDLKATPGDLAKFDLVVVGGADYKVGTPLDIEVTGLDKFDNPVDLDDPPILEIVLDDDEDDEEDSTRPRFQEAKATSVALRRKDTAAAKYVVAAHEGLLGKAGTWVSLRAKGGAASSTVVPPSEVVKVKLAPGDPAALVPETVPRKRGAYEDLGVKVVDAAGNDAALPQSKTLTLAITSGTLGEGGGATSQFARRPRVKATTRDGSRFVFSKGFWLWGDLGTRIAATLTLSGGGDLPPLEFCDFTVDGPPVPKGVVLTPAVKECVVGDDVAFAFQLLDEAGDEYAKKEDGHDDVVTLADCDYDVKIERHLRDGQFVLDRDTTSELSPDGRHLRIIRAARDPGQQQREASQGPAGGGNPTAEEPEDAVTTSGDYAVSVEVSLHRHLQGVVPVPQRKMRATATLRAKARPPVRLALKNVERGTFAEEVDLPELDWCQLGTTAVDLCPRLDLVGLDQFGNAVDTCLPNLRVEWAIQPYVDLFYHAALGGPRARRIKLKRSAATAVPEGQFSQMKVILRKQEGAPPFQGRRKFHFRFLADGCASAKASFVLADLSLHENVVLQKREACDRKERDLGDARRVLIELGQAIAKANADIGRYLGSLQRPFSQGVVGDELRLRIFGTDTHFFKKTVLTQTSVVQGLVEGEIEARRREVLQNNNDTNKATNRAAPWDLSSYSRDAVGLVRELFYVEGDAEAELLAWHLGRDSMGLLVTADEAAAKRYATREQRTRALWTFTARAAPAPPHRSLPRHAGGERASQIWQRNHGRFGSEVVRIVADRDRAHEGLAKVRDQYFGRVVLFAGTADDVRDYRSVFAEARVPLGGYTFLSLGDRQRNRDGTYGGRDGYFQPDARRPVFPRSPPLADSPEFKALGELRDLLDNGIDGLPIQRAYDALTLKTKAAEAAEANLAQLERELSDLKHAQHTAADALHDQKRKDPIADLTAFLPHCQGKGPLGVKPEPAPAAALEDDLPDNLLGENNDAPPRETPPPAPLAGGGGGGGRRRQEGPSTKRQRTDPPPTVTF